MKKERIGADFVLYESDGVRRAIRFVNFFFSVMQIVGREMGHDLIWLGRRRMHEHFPEFIEGLSPPLTELEKDYYTLRGDTCLAVDYHDTAYSNPRENGDSEVLATQFFLHRPIDATEKMREIMIEAAMLGVPQHMTYHNIAAVARVALEKMLA